MLIKDVLGHCIFASCPRYNAHACVTIDQYRHLLICITRSGFMYILILTNYTQFWSRTNTQNIATIKLTSLTSLVITNSKHSHNTRTITIINDNKQLRNVSNKWFAGNILNFEEPEFFNCFLKYVNKLKCMTVLQTAFID